MNFSGITCSQCIGQLHLIYAPTPPPPSPPIEEQWNSLGVGQKIVDFPRGKIRNTEVL